MLKTPLPVLIKTTFLFLFFLMTGIIHSQPDVSYQPYIGASEGLNAPIELVSAPGDPSGRLLIVVKNRGIKIWK